MDDLLLSQYVEEKQRLESFRKPHIVNKKKYSWRYKVIPSDYLAKLGFYFYPSSNQQNKIQADSIKCIYCNRSTYGLKSCRSKSKDVLDTMSNVLLLHIDGNETNCLMSYLKLKLLNDERFNLGTSDWLNDRFFNKPFQSSIFNLFKKTLLNNTLNDNNINGKINLNDIIRAGLIKYDSSFSGFKEKIPHYDSITSAIVCLCIYCKKIVMIPLDKNTSNISPIELHFKECSKGNCYYFKTLQNLESIPTLTTDFVKKFHHDYSDIEERPSRESVIHHVEMFNSTQDVVKENNDSSLNISTVDRKRDLEENILPNNTLKNQKDSFRSPTKTKKRKLLKSSPRRISSSDFSFANADSESFPNNNDTKTVTVNFEDHVIRKKNKLKRSNKLLDDNDESDVFSFSNQGHSTFDLPVLNTMNPQSMEPSQSPSPLKNKNNLLPTTRDSSHSHTTPKTLFLDKKIELLPDTKSSRGKSSPEYVTALSDLGAAQGTPSRSNYQNQPNPSLPSEFETSGFNTIKKNTIDRNHHHQTSLDKVLPESKSLADRSLSYRSIPLTKQALDRHEKGINKNETELKTKLESIQIDAELSSLSSSLSSSDSDSSESSTPIASPQHISKIPIQEYPAKYRRLRHL